MSFLRSAWAGWGGPGAAGQRQLRAMRGLSALQVILAMLGGQAQAQAQPSAAQRERFAAQCLACHGPGGVSSLPLTPSLAGQHSFYAITQLFLLREGRRDNAVMVEQTKGMSDVDLQAFADLIAQLPVAASVIAPTADAARIARGRALLQRLNCVGCHGADMAGGKQVPRLAGQREDYLRHALTGFRSGQRLGYTQAMSGVLAGVAAADIDDLAHALAHFALP